MNNKRKDHYAVVSKSGFTQDAVRLAKMNGVYTFTLEYLYWLDE